jgi:hypothetical protein
MASPGGVPERPKGTGCKPVGSAYGGSNPPAPTSPFAGSRRGLRTAFEPSTGSPESRSSLDNACARADAVEPEALLSAGESQNTVLVFILGLIATLGTVLGLAAIGGGAEIVRRNALGELRVGAGLVLLAVLLAAISALSPGRNAKLLLVLGALVGVSGLAVAGWGVTKRSPGRPAINVTFTEGSTPTLRVMVKAGGLSADKDLNLWAVAFRNAYGNGLGERLIRASFGPDPSGDASVQAQVPIRPGKHYRSVVIRAWVGDPANPGLCFFEKESPSRGHDLGPPPKTGCVIFPLAPREP